MKFNIIQAIFCGVFFINGIYAILIFFGVDNKNISNIISITNIVLIVLYILSVIIDSSTKAGYMR